MLKRTSALKRPKYLGCLTNNISSRDKPPIVTIIAIIAVISQHKVLVSWHRHGSIVVLRLLFYIFFLERLIVDIDRSLFLDRIRSLQVSTRAS